MTIEIINIEPIRKEITSRGDIGINDGYPNYLLVGVYIDFIINKKVECNVSLMNGEIDYSHDYIISEIKKLF